MKLFLSLSQSVRNIVIGIFFILVVGYLVFCRPFEQYELFIFDWFFSLRPPGVSSSRVVLVEISEESLKKLGSWPIPRDFHASIVDILSHYKAQAIVFDMVFSEKTAYDNLLISAFQKAKNVYLPVVFQVEKASSSQSSSEFALVSEEKIASSAVASGHINVSVDRDGKIRRLPFLLSQGRKTYLPLGARVACDILQANPEKIVVGQNRIFLDGKISVPVYKGTFLVNYAGDFTRTFTHTSYLEILRSHQAVLKGKKPSFDLTQLQGKVCFIGLTAVGTSDLRPTPVGVLYPLVGLQANIFHNLMTGKFLVQIGEVWNFLLCSGFLLLGWIVFLACSLRKGIQYLFLLIFGYATLAFLLFAFTGLWILVFTPTSTLAALFFCSALLKAAQEVRRRGALEKELVVAREIQSSFLPLEDAPSKQFQVEVFFLPAKFVAGDFYDFVIFNEHASGIFIGDVAGKGVPASLIMAQTLSLFRIYARQESSPAKVLTLLNHELSGRLKGRFVTALYAVFDFSKRTCICASAGHSSPVYCDTNKLSSKYLSLDSGIPLGVIENYAYRDNTFDNIAPRDKFIFYTDGVTEARNRAQQEFGPHRFLDYANAFSGLRAADVAFSLKERLLFFSRNTIQHDDVTVVVAEI